MSRIELFIDLKVIVHNYQQIEKTVSPAGVMAVLKANAYGLGLVPIARVLDEAGVSRFGVASVEEAIALREITTKPIQILGDLLPHEVQPAISLDIICPGSNEEILKRLSAEAIKQKKKVVIHYLIDTGMGRLGFPLEKAPTLIKKTQDLPNVEIEGIFSHFPCANDISNPINARQIDQFKNLTKEFPFPVKHLANSDGINNIKNSYFDMVRTGINLYGVFDLLGHRSYTLRPALTLQTRLIANRFLKKNSPIGYGSTYVLPQDSRVGTLPIGYADGLPLNFNKQGQVLIEGKIYPIIGRISMDYTTIDLGLEKIPLNTPVTIIGKSKSPRSSDSMEITVEDLAKQKGTHPYDIICSIGNRVKRVYCR